MSAKGILSTAVGAAVWLALALLGACSRLAPSTHDWAFVQSVGGISIGAPQRDDAGRVRLPITCDVSGTSAVTVSPTTVNSGLACEAPQVQIEGSSIYLAIRTSVPSEHHPSARCPEADLGRLAPGVYNVYYGAPPDTQHLLGAVEVAAP